MSKRIKVLIAGPYPEQEGIRVGGVQVYTDYLSAGLAAMKDIEAHVVTAVRGLRSTREFRTSNGVNVCQVPLFHRHQFLADWTVNAPRINRIARKVNPDIVHVQTSRLYPRAVLERGFPSVITIHGIYYEEAKLFTSWKDRIQSLYCSIDERSNLKRAKHVICLNAYALSATRRLLRTDDVRLIDNSVDDVFFEAERNEQPDRVLFAGLITERKNVILLLEAASILKKRGGDPRVRIAGHILDQGYYERCAAFVEANGLERNVEFVGNVPADQMVHELAQANVMVLPAKQETSPMIISEAMAVGTPVIATPVGGIPEVVKDGETGFIVALGDAEILAERMGCLLRDRNLRSQMSASCRRLASERFRRSVNLEKTVSFYHDILSNDK